MKSSAQVAGDDIRFSQYPIKGGIADPFFGVEMTVRLVALPGLE